MLGGTASCQHGEAVVPDFFDKIPSTILSVVDDISNDYPEQPLCRYKNSLYLQKNWVFETHIVNYLNRLLHSLPSLQMNDAIPGDCSLNNKQKKAVELAFTKRLSVISGGPGTGKTYTAGSFVSLFIQVFGKNDLKIALTAPTGKAASKLRSSLGKIDNVQVDALTLHALLNLSPDSPYSFPPKKMLPYDLILVDECSMIDVKLMASLLPSVKDGARIILLGDPDQLPSVEAGSLFSDIIEVLDDSEKVQLDECLRVDLKELVSFGKAINQGNISSFPSCVTHIKPNNDHVWKSEDELMSEIVRHFPSSHSIPDTIEAFDKFRVLSPLRNGLLGVDKLNDKLLNFVYQKTPNDSEYAVPIMITRNDSKRELFNGETGLLVRKKGISPFELQKNDYALFGERKIPAFLLPAFEYAYCMSVHKSQGSEFDHVMLVLPKGSEWFGQEMLYTAVTRAKKQLTLWGDDAVIYETLKHRSHRASGIIQRLHQFR